MAAITERIGKDGRKSYRVRVRLRGYPLVTETFARKTDAKEWSVKTEAAIKEGRYTGAIAKGKTLNDMIDHYIATTLLQRNDADKMRVYLNYWKERLGDYYLTDIDQLKISSVRDELAKTTTRRGTPMAPATVRRYLMGLSHVYSTAIKEWGWLNNNPVHNVSKPKIGSLRCRFLRDDERKALLTACAKSEYEPLYLIVVLAISTGARYSEIMNLRWEDIDLNRGHARLMNTKNKERRVLPLTSHAHELVTAYSKVTQKTTGLLFPNSTTGEKPFEIRKYWDKAVEEANLQDFHFHDLRHTAASYLAMNGASLIEIADVLGHKTLQMVKRYAHLTDSHAMKVVGAMNDKIFRPQNTK